jgi:hypothetical protein
MPLRAGLVLERKLAWSLGVYPRASMVPEEEAGVDPIIADRL